MRLGLGTDISVGYRQPLFGGVPLLLDTYTGAAAAYSLRQLRTGVTNVVRVRRDTTPSAEQDFTAEEITDGTLLAFVGAGNNGYVVTWYDQSGNGNDATQATAANQPKIVDAGVLVTENGKAALDFDGVNDCLITSQNNPFTFTGGVSLIHASYKDSTAYKDYETILSAGTTGNTMTNSRQSMGFGYGNSIHHDPKPTISTDIWYPSGIQYDGTVSTNESRIVGFYISNWSTHRSTGLSALRSNGSDLITKIYRTIETTSLNINPIKIGVFDQSLSSSFFNGKIYEVIAYNSDQSSNRIGIETNINEHYAIYP